MGCTLTALLRQHYFDTITMGNELKGNDMNFMDMIREDMRESVCRYLMFGYPIGDFLTAMLCNDLMRAAMRADSGNMQCLAGYAQLLYNLDPDCFGSEKKIEDYQKARQETPHPPSRFYWMSDSWKVVAERVYAELKKESDNAN